VGNGKNTGYKCLGCGKVSGPHGWLGGITHKKNCPLEAEIWKQIRQTQYEVANDLPLTPGGNGVLYLTRW
jgi:hypothetical protein